MDEPYEPKAPIAKLADKVSGVFVPVVITIAVIATAAWLLTGHSGICAVHRYSLRHQPLLRAGPYATLTAIMVGTGPRRGERHPHQVAGGFETTHSVNTVVPDKTGTIIEGKPVVTDVVDGGIGRTTSLRRRVARKARASAFRGHRGGGEKESLTFLSVDKPEQILGQGIRGEVEASSAFA